MGTALEAYTIDHGKGPVDYNIGAGDPRPAGLPASQTSFSGVLHPGYYHNNKLTAGLTTPVAYITNCWVKDPFVGTDDSIPLDEQYYSYNWMPESATGTLWGRTGNSRYGNPTYGYRDLYGNYRLGSVGPDRKWYNHATEKNFIRGSIIYDPTNGTNSYGNIWRSQKDSLVKARPKGDTLN